MLFILKPKVEDLGGGGASGAFAGGRGSRGFLVCVVEAESVCAEVQRSEKYDVQKKTVV